MSDQAANHFEKDASETPSESPKRSFTLSITLQPDGTLELSGPLQNKVLAFGLLGAAQAQLTELWTKRSLMEDAAKAQASRGGIPGIMKRMNGG